MRFLTFFLLSAVAACSCHSSKERAVAKTMCDSVAVVAVAGSSSATEILRQSESLQGFEAEEITVEYYTADSTATDGSRKVKSIKLQRPLAVRRDEEQSKLQKNSNSSGKIRKKTARTEKNNEISKNESSSGIGMPPMTALLSIAAGLAIAFYCFFKLK